MSKILEISRVIVALNILLALSPTQGRPYSPSYIKMLSSKVRGDEECVRTSQYFKPQFGYVCKNLGQCYQDRCGAIARHCSQCGDEIKGPCIDYSATTPTTRSKRSSPPIETDVLDFISSFMKVGLPTFSPFNHVPIEATIEPIQRMEPVIVETIGNAIVHLRAGKNDCAGFVARINDGSDGRYLILTAAQCVINFDVQCTSERATFGSKFRANPTSGDMIDGFMTYQYNHSSPCFGDYDADVSKVTKGFRSYAVVVTSYTGQSFSVPLNSDHVIVPRDYLECQDCRSDFSGIKISEETAGEILRGTKPFKLNADKNPIDLETSDLPNFVVVKSGSPPTLLRRATDVKFCTINHATEQKMCFNLPLPPMSTDGNQDLLSGSPVFLVDYDDIGEPEYHCIGIFTGYYTTFHKQFSVDQLTEDMDVGNRTGSDVTEVHGFLDSFNDGEGDMKESLEISFTKNGAVRITRDVVRFFETLLNRTEEENVTRNEGQVHPQYECYPGIGDPLSTEEQFCLCSLGWKNEGTGCKEPSGTTGDGCTWTGANYECEPRLTKISKRNLREVPASRLQEIIVPGIVENIDLRGQGIADIVALKEMLRHVTSLKILYLDYNEIEELPAGIFDSNRDLHTLTIRHNQMKRIHSDTFRYNKNLIMLNLADNELTVLHERLLEHARNLHYVSLQNNKISKVPSKLFRSNRNLAKLYLGNNKIFRLPAKLLRSQSLLTEVWMNHNFLQHIPRVLFTSCAKLRLIDLSRNKIVILSRNLFDGNLDLKFVNFSDNRLRVIPKRLFNNNKKLISVSLLRNPLITRAETKLRFKKLKIPLS